MNRFGKVAPLRLDADRYRELRSKIFTRDGWRCQHCGRRDELEIHHIVRRSQGGADDERNLMVLCRGCHCALHRSPPGDNDGRDARDGSTMPREKAPAYGSDQSS